MTANNIEDSNAASGRDYEVGYKRPPKQYRFKPGQSGNPHGRPKGSVNAKAIMERVACEPVTVRQGEKTRKMPMLQAVAHAQATKGAGGDTRAASSFFNMVHRTGVLTDAGDESAVGDAKGSNSRTLVRSNIWRPSDELVRGVKLDSLSRDELTDLSRLAEKIDLGGDATALSDADFPRLKFIINKGRGKDVTPLQ